MNSPDQLFKSTEHQLIQDVDKYTDFVIKLILQHGPKLILAVLVLITGLFIIKNLTRLIEKVFNKRKVDPTLSPFLLSIINWSMKVLLLISVASMIGVETTSFVALIGAAGLAVGLALQGSLANFAGGVLILIFRPFVKGDFIQAQSHEGYVQRIDLFSTIITTLDNKKVIIPNGPLAGGNIINYTSQPLRRVDLSIGISYKNDPRKAVSVLLKMCQSHPLVVQDPPPFVGVWSYADSSININIRAWTKTETYWDVYYQLNEQIKYTLDESQIEIPFPQRDISITNISSLKSVLVQEQ